MEHNLPATEQGAAKSTRSRLDFVLLGVVAAGAALAASELVAGLFLSAPSLVRTIGQRVIDVSPVPVVDWAISTFGTNDKLVLVIGIVVVSLVIGGFLGLLARDRPSLAAAGFVAFGVVGYVAGRTDPLAGALLTVVAAVAAVTMGVGVLLGLRFLLQRSVSPPAGVAAGSRRVFLTASAATVAVSVGEFLLGRYFGSRLRSAVFGREQVTLPTAFPSADAAIGREQVTLPTASPSADPATTTTEAGVADTISTTGATSATAETVPDAEAPSTTAAASETTQAPEAPATSEADAAAGETTGTTEPTAAETTQPVETATVTTEASQQADTTTTQPATTETTRQAGTTTTQPVETTTTTKPVETTTTTKPVETTTTTKPVETTTTTKPVETTTTTEPRVSGVAAPTRAQIAPVEGVSDLITPNDEFYVIDTALSVPRVDLRTWTLSFTGLVDTPFSVTYDELLAMPLVERYITLACVSNRVGGDLVGNAKWLGVPLWRLVERAGVRSQGTQLVGRSVDRFTVGFPTGAVFDGREAMVAVGMNGEPLPLRHGFPARLVVSGLYGYVSATKWLSEVEFTRWDDFDAYWIPRGWAKQAPIKTQSRIDTPRQGDIRAGINVIAGVAWAQNRGVRRVQVRVDDGEWMNANLPDELSIDSWRQWYLEYDFTPGPHRISVRAADATGETQTGKVRPPRPDGATGYHTIRVTAA